MQKITFFFFVLVLALSACKKPEYEFGPLPDRFKVMEGTFKLTKVEQIDEQQKDQARKKLDVSKFMGTTPSVLTLSQPNTFTISRNDTPDLMGLKNDNFSTTWAFDDDKYPSKLLLGNGLELRLYSPINDNTTALVFNAKRTYKGKAVVSYALTFTKQ